MKVINTLKWWHTIIFIPQIIVILSLYSMHKQKTNGHSIYYWKAIHTLMLLSKHCFWLEIIWKIFKDMGYCIITLEDLLFSFCEYRWYKRCIFCQFFFNLPLRERWIIWNVTLSDMNSCFCGVDSKCVEVILTFHSRQWCLEPNNFGLELNIDEQPRNYC